MDNRTRGPVTTRASRQKKAREKKIRRIITCVILAVLVILLVILGIKLFAGGDKENNASGNNIGANASGNASDAQGGNSSASGDPNEVVARANIVSTGDILIHQMILDNSKASGGYAFDQHFTKIKDKISSADLAVANFEITLGGAERGYSCYPCFNIPDSIGTALKNSGFDFMVTANNHCYDSSFDGLKRTVNTLTDMGFVTTGTRSALSQKKYKVVDVNGIKIGIVNYTYETDTDKPGRKALNGILMAEEAGDYVNSFHEKNLSSFYSEMEKNIKDMKNDGAEAIVLYIHWGVEYQLKPNATQKQIAQKMCDLGVDAIIGGHPHVVQSAEVLTSSNGDRKTFCIYSVGNALSNQRTEYMGVYGTGHTEDGILVYTEFVKYGDGRVELDSVNYVPTWVNRFKQGSQYVYEITPLDNISAVSPNNDSARKSLARTEAIVAEGFNSFNKG